MRKASGRPAPERFAAEVWEIEPAGRLVRTEEVAEEEPAGEEEEPAKEPPKSLAGHGRDGERRPA
jgi:hypothetical protein